MKFLFALLSLLTVFLPLHVSAAPSSELVAIEERQANLHLYKLRTHVLPHVAVNPAHSHFDGLWLQPFHTGAGFSDVVLTTNRSATYPGFLNGTYQQFLLEPLGPDYFPWGLYVNVLVEYTFFSTATWNVGYGSEDGAYYLNTTHTPYPQLEWNTAGTPANPTANHTTNQNDFGGWIVCDWWHGLPQLFWRYGEYYFDSHNHALPKNCEHVALEAVYQ